MKSDEQLPYPVTPVASLGDMRTEILDIIHFVQCPIECILLALPPFLVGSFFATQIVQDLASLYNYYDYLPRNRIFYHLPLGLVGLVIWGVISAIRIERITAKQTTPLNWQIMRIVLLRSAFAATMTMLILTGISRVFTMLMFWVWPAR